MSRHTTTAAAASSSSQTSQDASERSGMVATVERRRYASQSGEPFPGYPNDTDHVIVAFAKLLGSRVTPRAARQRLRRLEEALRLFAMAAHREGAPHRLVRLHCLTAPVCPTHGLDREDWVRAGQRDRAEDAARESLHLSDGDVDDLRRYRNDLAREIAEKMQLMQEVDAEIVARG